MDTRYNGDDTALLLQFEQGATAWYTVYGFTPVIKNGRPAASSVLQVGDWVRLLVNQAVLQPGYMMESVKEMRIEGAGHDISSIIKGRLSGIHPTQNKLNIVDAMRLTPRGWGEYTALTQFDIRNKDIEYFYNGRQVTFSYVSQYLRRADADVYLAMENNYAGETVRVVSFRTGRDEPLRQDTVLSTDGAGGFLLLSNPNTIATDPGTLVRRNNRLVGPLSIFGLDYVQVALNGADTAAVVDIGPAPGTSGVQILIGRVYSVDEGKSFQIEGFRVFDGTEWHYAPIPAVYTIDHRTLFVNQSGPTQLKDFITYGPEIPAGIYSGIGDYVFVAEGGRAARITDIPYAQNAFRGTIYDIDTTTGAISIKNVFNYNAVSGEWVSLRTTTSTLIPGLTNDASYATLTTEANTLIVDRHQVIDVKSLRVGQQIKVFTGGPKTATPVSNGGTAAAHIILVEQP
jgi:hypothetical protein